MPDQPGKSAESRFLALIAVETPAQDDFLVLGQIFWFRQISC